MERAAIELHFGQKLLKKKFFWGSYEFLKPEILPLMISVKTRFLNAAALTAFVKRG